MQKTMFGKGAGTQTVSELKFSGEVVVKLVESEC